MVDYALDTFGDQPKRSVMQADLDKLGPDAMLADVSQEWMSIARGAA